jgi:hypothetical protein
MAIFSELFTDLLDAVNRPANDGLVAVKREINNAIMQTQRRHRFKMAERLVRFTYPAGADFVDLTDVCGGLPRDFIFLQSLAAPDSANGQHVDFMSYGYLMNERRNWNRSQTSAAEEFLPANMPTGDESTHSAYVQNLHRFYAFLINSKIGLYPRPSSDVYLLLNLHIWLPKLVNDTDTNFFLDYCYDYVHMMALRKLHVFFKVDSRYSVTDKEVQEAWNDVQLWDGTISNTPLGTHA